MSQKRSNLGDNLSSSSDIFPVKIPGGCGRKIPNKGFQGEMRKCGDPLERFPGYFIACAECFSRKND